MPLAEPAPGVEPRAAIAPELYRCPVRRRYLWQLWRYSRPARRWRARLHAGAEGRRASADELSRILQIAEEQTLGYPRSFAAAGVCWPDLREPGDLARFPVLERSALQERHLELFSQHTRPIDIAEGWVGATSGSTGQPVRFFMDGESIHFFSAFLRFLWERHRLGPLPQIGSTGVVLLCTLPRSAIYETRMPLLRWTRFRKLHWGEPDAAAELQQLSPAIVTGDPDSLARLAEALDAGAVRVRPRLILSSAFALPEQTAARLRDATGAAVVDYYSLAETGPVAWKCPSSGLFHLLEGAVEVEIERGELLLTNLRNRLFPLVRYRTGDLARWAPEGACACGFRGRSIERLEGRVAARFLSASGQRVDPSQLQPLLSKLPLTQFQLEQLAPDLVRLSYCAGAPLPEGATDELERGLRRLLAGPVRLRQSRVAGPLFAPGEKPIVYRGLADPAPSGTGSASSGSASSA